MKEVAVDGRSPPTWRSPWKTRKPSSPGRSFQVPWTDPEAGSKETAKLLRPQGRGSQTPALPVTWTSSTAQNCRLPGLFRWKAKTTFA